MYNKKLLLGLCNVVGVVLILMFVVNIIMYIWGFFGNPPIPTPADPSLGLRAYYVLLNQLMIFTILYIVVGAMSALVKASKLPEGK